MTGPFGVTAVTLFPEFFGDPNAGSGPLSVGLVGRAFREGRASFSALQPRDFAEDRHRSVDGSPYGGGAGMVMRVEPLAAAIEAARQIQPGPVVLLSPRGRPLAQADFARWAKGPGLALVCGRYEGFDERVRSLVDDEVSIGDYVLTGGEAAAAAVIDGVVRLLPETLGNPESAAADSFSDGILEHPHYTRPDRWRGLEVPEVLRGGNHAELARWRRARQLETTAQKRPELLTRVRLSYEERRALIRAPRRLELVVPAAGIDLARLAAAAAAWEVRLHVFGPAKGSLEALEVLAWPSGRRRPASLEVDLEAHVQVHPDRSSVEAHFEGTDLEHFAVDDRHPEAGPSTSPEVVLSAARAGGAVVWIADAPSAFPALPAPRQAVEAAKLDAAARALVVMDRVLGEI